MHKIKEYIYKHKNEILVFVFVLVVVMLFSIQNCGENFIFKKFGKDLGNKNKKNKSSSSKRCNKKLKRCNKAYKNLSYNHRNAVKDPFTYTMCKFARNKNEDGDVSLDLKFKGSESGEESLVSQLITHDKLDEICGKFKLYKKDKEIEVARGMVNRRRDDPAYDIIGGIAGFS